MGKRIQYTKITPLPSNVPRQLAIELLHAHEEVIALNPLVTGSKRIDAPREAPNDEYFSTWYEISEIITWGFGMKKKISFRGVFHDLPYGMQSHVYAPMGVDLRNKYRIGGNQPGEPREARELGVDTPLDGLYLREDVEIVCNLALSSFVKKETQAATGKMIDRLTRKAELLDEGKLHAMFEDGKLKTSKPTFSSSDHEGSSVAGSSPPQSPTLSTFSGMASPRLDKRGFGNYHDVARSASQHKSGSLAPGGGVAASSSMTAINELPGDMYQQPQNVPNGLKPNGMSFRSELPGDSTFTPAAPSPQPSPRQVQQDLKPPGASYQAYIPAQQQQQQQQQQLPQRNSYYSDHSSTIPTPEMQSRQLSFAAPSPQPGSNWPLANQTEPGASNPNPSRLSQDHAQAQAPSNIIPDHQRYSQSSSTTAQGNIIPDHQRFSQMSLQPQPHPHPPPRNPARRSSATPLGGGGGAQNAKCPVCGMFEGDEAAVSHHVSKAHFS